MGKGSSTFIEPLEPRRLLSAGVLIESEFFATRFTLGKEVYFALDQGFTTGNTNIEIHTQPQSIWRTDGSKRGTLQIPAPEYFTNPINITPLGDDKVLFMTAGGYNLYVYDRASGQSSLLKTFVNRAEGGMIASRGVAYFSADDVTSGREVWRSDGTEAGTYLLKDIDPGADQSIPRDFVADDDGTVYFFAEDGPPIPSIWRTDGTAGGTIRIAGIGWEAANTVAELTPIGKRLFYARSSGIYIADGTSDTLVKEFAANPVHLTVYGNKVVFVADDGTHGSEWWISDGSASGTFMLRDVGNDAYGSGADYFPDARDIAIVGDTLYFAASPDGDTNKLFRSDGTVAGTVSLGDKEHVSNLTAAGDLLYYSAGGSVWRTDGTDAGKVRELVGQEFGDWWTGEARFTAWGRKLFFVTTRGEAAHQLWEIDPDAGGIAGTVFDDVDADGVRDAGEEPLRGYKVFIDKNNDGICNTKEQWTRASSTGRYTFDLLPAGMYTIRIVGVEGRRGSTHDSYRVRVAPNATVTRYFGRTDKPIIGGLVYMDANKSSSFDAGEVGIAGWTAYIDADHDGVLDEDEVTAVTDAAGKFMFTTLSPGTHWVRVVGNSNYRQTVPGAGYRRVTVGVGEVIGKSTFGLKRLPR